MAHQPGPGPPTAAQTASDIPLVCHICVKANGEQIHFSDQSHLLTHIASKSHLHREFGTRHKGAENPDLQLLVNRYDAWYAIYGIDALVKDRIKAKERKRRVRQGLPSEVSSQSANK